MLLGECFPLCAPLRGVFLQTVTGGSAAARAAERYSPFIKNRDGIAAIRDTGHGSLSDTDQAGTFNQALLEFLLRTAVKRA